MMGPFPSVAGTTGSVGRSNSTGLASSNGRISRAQSRRSSLGSTNSTDSASLPHPGPLSGGVMHGAVSALGGNSSDSQSHQHANQNAARRPESQSGSPRPGQTNHDAYVAALQGLSDEELLAVGCTLAQGGLPEVLQNAVGQGDRATSADYAARLAVLNDQQLLAVRNELAAGRTPKYLRTGNLADLPGAGGDEPDGTAATNPDQLPAKPAKEKSSNRHSTRKKAVVHVATMTISGLVFGLIFGPVAGIFALAFINAAAVSVYGGSLFFKDSFKAQNTSVPDLSDQLEELPRAELEPLMVQPEGAGDEYDEVDGGDPPLIDFDVDFYVPDGLNVEEAAEEPEIVEIQHEPKDDLHIFVFNSGVQMAITPSEPAVEQEQLQQAENDPADAPDKSDSGGAGDETSPEPQPVRSSRPAGGWPTVRPPQRLATTQGAGSYQGMMEGSHIPDRGRTNNSSDPADNSSPATKKPVRWIKTDNGV